MRRRKGGGMAPPYGGTPHGGGGTVPAGGPSQAGGDVAPAGDAAAPGVGDSASGVGPGAAGSGCAVSSILGLLMSWPVADAAAVRAAGCPLVCPSLGFPVTEVYPGSPWIIPEEIG